VYLADGVDTCHLNSKARGLIRKYVNRKISLGSVGGQQSGDDHCGSSAVLIGLEYPRMMKNGEIQERILFPAGLKIKMIKKTPSQPGGWFGWLVFIGRGSGWDPGERASAGEQPRARTAT